MHHSTVNDRLLDIKNATFHDQVSSHKGSVSTLFPNLSFSLPTNDQDPRQYWSVLSPKSSAGTSFLKILQGKYTCTPPNARRYPGLPNGASDSVCYVGFDAERGGIGKSNLQGAYLSARYESRREETDFSLESYLTGQTVLNALASHPSEQDIALLAQVTRSLNLGDLLERPVSSLSNGQTRRARIGRALMTRPRLLLLDGPFMGLDPTSVRTLSDVLHELARSNAPHVFLSLRQQDHLPSWITHLVLVDPHGSRVIDQGPVQEMRKIAEREFGSDQATQQDRHTEPGVIQNELQQLHETSGQPASAHEAVVEMQGVVVSYGNQPILGHWTEEGQSGLHWTIRRGDRWVLCGPNGSGKTTLLSLMTSDHPQAYSLPVKLFGRARLPSQGERGISVFELQRRIGHSSPEVHTFFPKHLSVRRVLESAFADAPLSKPNLDDSARRRVSRCLQWFQTELKAGVSFDAESDGKNDECNLHGLLAEHTNAATDEARHDIEYRLDELVDDDAGLRWTLTTTLRELSFSSQRLLLFLRAIVANQELAILDEAFSGMDESVKAKALLFLSFGENKYLTHDGRSADSALVHMDRVSMSGLSDQQALVTISHTRSDVPACITQWICLPEPGALPLGQPARTGLLPGPMNMNPHAWEEIWGIYKSKA